MNQTKTKISTKTKVIIGVAIASSMALAAAGVITDKLHVPDFPSFHRTVTYEVTTTGTRPYHSCGSNCTLEDAIDAAAVSTAKGYHVVIHVPAGTYSYFGEMTLTGTTRIYGDGIDSTIIEHDAAESDEEVMLISPNAEATITDLTLVGSGRDDAIDYGIRKSDVANVTVKRCKIENFSGDGISNYTGEGLVIVEDSEILDNAQGIMNQGMMQITNTNVHNNTTGIWTSQLPPYSFVAYTTIRNSTISNNDRDGITGFANINIYDSTIDANVLTGIYLNNKDLLVDNTLIENNQLGGIITTHATVTVTDSQINNNDNTIALIEFGDPHGFFDTDQYGGGGLLIYGGSLSISGSEITNNTARHGGGIYFNRTSATSTIVNTTISDNYTSLDMSGAGGGIEALNSTRITVDKSLISGNQAYIGAAIKTSSSNIFMVNSTVFANEIKDIVIDSELNRGVPQGIIDIGEGLGLLSYNSTIAGNFLGNHSNYAINTKNSDGSAWIKGCIIANNETSDGVKNNCSDDVNSDDYNISDDETCDFTHANDLQNTDPELSASLADHGGATQTLSIDPSSPAYNYIPEVSCLGIDDEPIIEDQRGLLRPAKYLGNFCDVGSYEVQKSVSL